MPAAGLERHMTASDFIKAAQAGVNLLAQVVTPQMTAASNGTKDNPLPQPTEPTQKSGVDAASTPAAMDWKGLFSDLLNFSKWFPTK